MAFMRGESPKSAVHTVTPYSITHKICKKWKHIEKNFKQRLIIHRLHIELKKICELKEKALSLQNQMR